MNHITNYYKNLSEQLQQQVNFLEKQILEAYVHSPDAKRLGGRAMPGETPTQTGERLSKAASKRESQIKKLGHLAKDNPEEYGDLYTRLIADVLKSKPEARIGVGLETKVEKKAQEDAIDVPPARAANRPGIKYSGFADRHPDWGYLTTDELRKIISGIKSFDKK